MIAKPAQVTLLCRINKFALIEGHEIEMLDPFLIVLSHAPPEICLVDHLSDVLENKLVRSQVELSTETKPLLVGFDDGHIRVFPSLESLILAFGAAAAIIYTFNLGRAIDTIRVFTTCVVSANCRV